MSYDNYSSYEQQNQEKQKIVLLSEKMAILKGMVDDGLIPIEIACLRLNMSVKEFLENTK